MLVVIRDYFYRYSAVETQSSIRVKTQSYIFCNFSNSYVIAIVKVLFPMDYPPGKPFKKVYIFSIFYSGSAFFRNLAGFESKRFCRFSGGAFFFLSGFLSQTLTTHRTAGEGRKPSFIPLYYFHPLTNIQTCICNFACEMTITYF